MAIHKQFGMVSVNVYQDGGQGGLMLWRATLLLRELNALLASTSRTASVSSSSSAVFIASTAASIPAICPAQSCNGPAAS